MMIIDVHAHAIVREALAEMATAHPRFGPSVVEEEGGVFLSYPGRSNLGPLPEAIFDPGVRVEDMDRMRVDVQIVAIPPPNFHYHVPADVGADFARIQNDALLELSRDRPDRIHVLGTLPLQDVEESVAEIHRLVHHPRLRGFQLGTNVDDVDLDDPSFEPVWAALESLGLPILLHPDQRAIAGASRIAGYYLQNLVGLPMESTVAAARLIFGGVLAHHPGLRVGLVHGGGFSPYQVGRWDHGWRVRDEPRAVIGDRAPSSYFGELFFDTLTHDDSSLGLLGERVGWRHVMLGSDYPFDMSAPDPVAAVERIGLRPEDQRRVLSETAEEFLRPLDLST